VGHPQRFLLEERLWEEAVQSLALVWVLTAPSDDKDRPPGDQQQVLEAILRALFAAPWHYCSLFLGMRGAI
jgi:hypothetical protein